MGGDSVAIGVSRGHKGDKERKSQKEREKERSAG